MIVTGLARWWSARNEVTIDTSHILCGQRPRERARPLVVRSVGAAAAAVRNVVAAVTAAAAATTRETLAQKCCVRLFVGTF